MLFHYASHLRHYAAEFAAADDATPLLLIH